MESSEPSSALERFLLETDRAVVARLDSSAGALAPADLADGVWSYLRRPAKRLRPAALLRAARAVGGDPERALPAAAAVELFHTWTLVHDDLIDNDELRRGAPTVHAAARARAPAGLAPERAREYGRDVAILAGDVLHGWAAALFLEAARALDAGVVIELARELETSVLAHLIEGELRDVQQALVPAEDWRSVSEDEVLRMLWLKTGALYEFCGRAGAALGLGSADRDEPRARALARFASECAVAFQLQDDVLGVTGDERRLGKPVGSDLREGKKPGGVLAALRTADARAEREILAVLGVRDAGPAEIERCVRHLRELGGIDRARALAEDRRRSALEHLKMLGGAGEAVLLLRAWADFLLARER